MRLKKPQKNNGWVGITNDFVDFELKEITPHGFVVYMCLLRHMDNKNHTCFPSQALIAKKTGINKRTVIRHIKRLHELGYISVAKNQKSEWLSNIYTLHRGLPKYKHVVTDKPPPDDNKYDRLVSESHLNNTQYNKNHLSRHTPSSEEIESKRRGELLKQEIDLLGNKMKYPP